MNAVNSTLSGLFDLVLAPFELIGSRTALVIVSGIFGVLALLAFKYISWQRGIKAAKDKIKAHMIEIRLYQDDLLVVGQAVGKVLWRNLQYVALNFGPFIPLAFPFLLVAAQFVVRYAYDPVPVMAADTELLAGRGTLVEVELKGAQRAQVAGLQVHLPAGLAAVSPLVRAPGAGRAFQEVIAVAPGQHEIVFELPDGAGGVARETKLFAAGETAPRRMQPRRVEAGAWYKLHDPDACSLLWPAEPGFSADSPFHSIAIAYPYRDLGWMPSGEVGILIVLVLASMLFGFLALKPLGVQI
jgi:hypothetical protein